MPALKRGRSLMPPPHVGERTQTQPAAAGTRRVGHQRVTCGTSTFHAVDCQRVACQCKYFSSSPRPNPAS
ncbi:MAG: hypothetical protein ACFFCW_33750, partial [Candidatus Hodarchaeota archaeon]